MKKLWIPLVLVLVAAGFVFSGYNTLVAGSEAVKGQWSQVETQLQRRSDLIPNLVATVKGYAAHEAEIFTAVADARTKLAAASSVGDTATADAQLNSALGRLLAIVENYPDLKANQNFMDLQNQLKELENKIAYARQFYNDVVLSFNNSREVFPSNLIANMFGFKEAELFKIVNEAEKEAPKVKF